MNYHKMLPYYISPELKEKGWESDKTRVYIPWPISTKGKYYYLGIRKEKKYYKYSRCEKRPDGTFKCLIGRTRDTTIDNDLEGKGMVVEFDPNHNRIINPKAQQENILRSIKLIMNTGQKGVTNEDIEDALIEIVEDIKSSDCLKILLDPYYNNSEYEEFQKNEYALIKQFESRKHVGKARQRLANWLKKRFDVILRKNSHDIYILDEDNNCYTEVTNDELLYKVSEILGPQLINDDDLKWALSYISDRLDPQHNIVKFSNCIFDMEKLEVINTDKPIFTLVETPYRYNPNAKSTVLKEFLNSSLKKSSPEKTEETILCIKQLTGYLFTSGNVLNVLPMITGVSGGGKSVFANILTAIFGKNKIADLKLQEIEKNVHATSSLVNKHLNIIQDSDNSAINNNSLIKQITGNDPLQVNPKHVHPYVLPKEEVPKTIVVCNNIPRFKKLEPALLERFLIIEFNVKFRGTDNENTNLLNEILDNPEEIEWFIYESIKAYKEMIKEGKDFALRKEGDATRQIVDKHQNPINYLLCQLIDEYDPNDSNILGYVYTNELNTAIRHLAKIEGIDLILNRKGIISSTTLINTIRYEFDLWDKSYQTQPHMGSRYYPGLVPNMKYWDIIDELFDDAEIPKEIQTKLTESKENQEAKSEEGENTTENI